MLFQFDIVEIVKTWGYIGLFFIVFAESGLFFGFFLPGDSLLFTAGFLASQNILNILVLVPLLVIAAITGDSVGFWMGNKFGSWLLRQKESFFFQKKYMTKAQEFYEKHGGKTIVLARFVPAVRPFAPSISRYSSRTYRIFTRVFVWSSCFVSETYSKFFSAGSFI